jgi:hypothetical protein
MQPDKQEILILILIPMQVLNMPVLVMTMLLMDENLKRSSATVAQL